MIICYAEVSGLEPRASRNTPPLVIPTGPPFPGGLIVYARGGYMRTDRQPGARGAFEAARLRILKTQTVCGICGKPVDFSYKAPHPLSPTVDHIIPVSRGGHPSDLANLQLAHRCCNRAKSDSLIEPRKAEESKTLPNDILEQHAVWTEYRS